MQQNSSRWLRRMREKHRRIWGIRERIVQAQLEGGRNEQVQEERVLEEKVQGKRVRGDQAQEERVRGDQAQRVNNVFPLKPRRSASGNKPSPPTLAELEADVWELRKQFILQIANRRNGKVRLQDVAAECNVNIRIAAEWLIRLSLEGMLSLVAGQRYTMTYLVREVGDAQK